MGIHYDYKSTRGDKAMKKEAKRKARIEQRRAKRASNNPKSLSEFWPRWHVSLGNFAKKYITQPISYLSFKRGINLYGSYFIAITLSFIFIAIWHKLSVSFLLFALITVFILMLERTVFSNVLKKLNSLFYGRFFCILYTQICFLICISPIKEDLQNIIIHAS